MAGSTLGARSGHAGSTPGRTPDARRDARRGHLWGASGACLGRTGRTTLQPSIPRKRLRRHIQPRHPRCEEGVGGPRSAGKATIPAQLLAVVAFPALCAGKATAAKSAKHCIRISGARRRKVDSRSFSVRVCRLSDGPERGATPRRPAPSAHRHQTRILTSQLRIGRVAPHRPPPPPAHPTVAPAHPHVATAHRPPRTPPPSPAIRASRRVWAAEARRKRDNPGSASGCARVSGAMCRKGDGSQPRETLH